MSAQNADSAWWNDAIDEWQCSLAQVSQSRYGATGGADAGEVADARSGGQAGHVDLGEELTAQGTPVQTREEPSNSGPSRSSGDYSGGSSEADSRRTSGHEDFDEACRGNLRTLLKTGREEWKLRSTS